MNKWHMFLLLACRFAPHDHLGDWLWKKTTTCIPQIGGWKKWLWTMAENVHYSGWIKHFRLRTFPIFLGGPDFQANRQGLQNTDTMGSFSKSIHPSYQILLGKLLALRSPGVGNGARQPLGHVVPLHVPSDRSPAQPSAAAQASQGPRSFDLLSSEKGCQLKEWCVILHFKLVYLGMGPFLASFMVSSWGVCRTI